MGQSQMEKDTKSWNSEQVGRINDFHFCSLKTSQKLVPPTKIQATER